MFLMRLLFLICLSLMVMLSSRAEVLRIPISQQGDKNINMPVHGDLQSQVLRRFGEPNVRHPSVGQPPISRWDYADFSVYFEHSTVVSSVPSHKSRTPAKP